MKPAQRIAAIPQIAINKIFIPLLNSIKVQQASGVLLLIAGVLSLILNNTAMHHDIHQVWESKIIIGFGQNNVQFTLHYFVNEALMTLFFVLVGLEIKRELIEGELSSLQKALLPVIAALGGMIVPALFYTLFNYDNIYSKGWGIPMATDIAFALTVMSILGNTIPISLKIFLTALAIVDDLGAIVVIALFYSDGVALGALGQSMLVYVILLGMGYAGVKNLWFYAFVGSVMWILFLPSGVHPTIAGVLFAFAIPMKTEERQYKFEEILENLENHVATLRNLKDKEETLKDQILNDIQALSVVIKSPLQNMIHQLHYLSSYIIMPLFAFANAGVYLGSFAATDLLLPVSLGIMVGLMLGKSLGIFLLSWLAVKFNIAQLPSKVNWIQFYGMAWLGGIGFTMSIFMADLSFQEPNTQEIAKVAILIASTLSGVVGFYILKMSCKNMTEIEKDDYVEV